MATVTEAPVVDAEISPDLPESLYEVIGGRHVEKTLGAFEYQIANRIQGPLWSFVKEHGLGTAEAEMLFLIDEASTLKLRPDVAFVSKARWPLRKQAPRTEAWKVIPDLTVEVVSPSNKAGELIEKMLDYQRAGVRLIWHVYPVQEVVLVFESPESVRVLNRDDTLDGGTVLPGFRLPLATLFEDDDEPVG